MLFLPPGRPIAAASAMAGSRRSGQPAQVHAAQNHACATGMQARILIQIGVDKLPRRAPPGHHEHDTIGLPQKRARLRRFQKRRQMR
jgi:hypothetical protein